MWLSKIESPSGSQDVLQYGKKSWSKKPITFSCLWADCSGDPVKTETNTSSRMMTHHPAWQTQNVAVSASGQWSCCSGAGSVFVPLWLSRLRDNSTDNSWDQWLSLSHRDIWFPPSAWSHGLPRAFLSPPQEHSLGHSSRSHGNSLWGWAHQCWLPGAKMHTRHAMGMCLRGWGGGARLAVVLSDSSTQQHSLSQLGFFFSPSWERGIFKCPSFM